jgi:hypothetical protein
MAFRGFGSDHFFVDPNAQPRALRDVNEAVLKGEDIWIVQIAS